MCRDIAVVSCDVLSCRCHRRAPAQAAPSIASGAFDERSFRRGCVRWQQRSALPACLHRHRHRLSLCSPKRTTSGHSGSQEHLRYDAFLACKTMRLKGKAGFAAELVQFQSSGSSVDTALRGRAQTGCTERMPAGQHARVALISNERFQADIALHAVT